MAISIPGVPSSVRVPLFYAQVDPSRANTLQRSNVALLVGQITSAGALTPPAPISATTSGTTAAANATLHFASVPAGVAPGQVVTDSTTNGVIPANTTVVSKTATTVTLSANCAAGGVGSGDTIVFTTPFVSAPVLATSQIAVDALCGQGSQLSLLYYYFRRNNLFTTVYLLPLQDDGAATQAGGTIDVSGAPSAAGTISLYVAGILVPVLVTTAMNATQIATAIANAINANTTLPMVAGTSGGTRVTIGARNYGLCGNDIDVRKNYYGAANGEADVPGVTIIITPLSGGATNPSSGLTTALSTLPEQAYDYVGHAYSDASCLNAFQTYFNDTAGQWSPQKMLYGGAFTAARATLGGLQTLGLARNDQHMTIIGAYDSPSPPHAWAGALCGMAALSLSSDPATPAREVVLQGILPPPLPSRFDFTGRNTLLWSGISTFKVIGGQVIVERLITTYQLNTFGTPDNSMLSVEKMFTLAEGIRVLKGRVEGRYGRMKLADDGTRLPPGANIVTPKVIKADLVAMYDSDLVGRGWFQDTNAFAAGLVVERNASDPDRVDVLWDGIVMDQLNVFALLAQFRLTGASPA